MAVHFKKRMPVHFMRKSLAIYKELRFGKGYAQVNIVVQEQIWNEI